MTEREFISTPKKPEVFTLQEIESPFDSSKTIFRAFREDGTALGMGASTVSELKARVRQSERVASFQIERLGKKKTGTRKPGRSRRRP